VGGTVQESEAHSSLAITSSSQCGIPVMLCSDNKLVIGHPMLPGFGAFVPTQAISSPAPPMPCADEETGEYRVADFDPKSVSYFGTPQFLFSAPHTKFASRLSPRL
jgi:hypothetical protein